MTGVGRTIAALLALLFQACAAPAPRLPFDQENGWHVFLSSGGRSSNDRYIHGYTASGVEFVTLVPGTAGWGWETGFRFGSDSGKDSERIRIRRDNVGFPNDIITSQAVPVERDRDVFELSVGVRQTYRLDSRVQPYFGVGGALVKTYNVDHLDLSGLPADVVPLPTAPRSVEHFQTLGLGLYLRTGLAWHVLRDQVREDTEAVIALDLRGLVGDESSYLELTLGLGFGR